MRKNAASVIPEEIGRFSAQAHAWWDENGPARPLHLMKQPRLDYIEMQLRNVAGRGLTGLNVLDVGCGAGLMSEALAGKGANVTGIDASEELIEAARAHGKAIKNLNYRCEAVENVTEKFDLVMALEVIEHVNDPAGFVEACAARVAKNGLMIFSTLNRNPKSFLMAIVGAEVVLRWIPFGTHDWRKFIRPSELSTLVHDTGFTTRDICGLVFNPLTKRFALDSSDVDVDYLLTAN
jgi:2-polyprenyl-6-hydroxyphenyl methylase/3-demethylubiquinone-9 3-methyltransferase